MQKTGFVQIPVERFLQLEHEAQLFKNLYAKVEREEKEREASAKKLVKMVGQRDEINNGERIILDFDIWELARYLGIPNKIHMDIKHSHSVGIAPRVTDIQAVFTDVPQVKNRVLREINAYETIS